MQRQARRWQRQSEHITKPQATNGYCTAAPLWIGSPKYAETEKQEAGEKSDEKQRTVREQKAFYVNLVYYPVCFRQ